MRFHRPALALSLALCAGSVAAEELTWKEANRRSAEELRADHLRKGAEYARKAFDLYAAQAPGYSVETHAQLLLNVVDARRRAEKTPAALKELDRGVEKIQEKAGAEAPTLIALWDEGARISSWVEGPATDRYFGKAIALAERLWGADDVRTIALHARWGRDASFWKGSEWSRAKLNWARERASVIAGGKDLVFDIDLHLAKLELEDGHHERGISMLRALLAANEAAEDARRPRRQQTLLGHLELAYAKAGDKARAAQMRAQRIAALGSAKELDVVQRVQPKYPMDALRVGAQGSVILQLSIGADGTVTDARVVAATPEGVFEESALSAVQKWKFRPKVVDGKPVPSSGLQVITYHMAR